MKVEFQKTPHNTIRAFVYYDEDKLEIIRKDEITLLRLLSIWGGADKDEKGMMSFELSPLLIPYLKDRFSIRTDFDLSRI